LCFIFLFTHLASPANVHLAIIDHPKSKTKG